MSPKDYGIVKAGVTIYCEGKPIQRTGEVEQPKSSCTEPPTEDTCLQERGVYFINVRTGRGASYSNVTTTGGAIIVADVDIPDYAIVTISD
jgi:hypothetical protein